MFPIVTAVCVVIFCLVFKGVRILLKKENAKRAHPTIPGPLNNSKEAIQFSDVDIFKRTMSLRRLNIKYGPIAALEKNGELSVIISDPELLKETKHMSFVPPQRAEILRNILGDNNFAFVSDEEAWERRKKYDLYFMMRACKTHFKVIKEVCEEFLIKMQNNSEKIPLSETVSNACVKTVLRTTFGDYFADDENLKSFMEEMKIIGNYQAKILEESSEESKTLKKAVDKIKHVVNEIIEARRQELRDTENILFIDVLIESDVTEGQRNSDGISIFLGSDTLLFAFTWLLYHLITSDEIQNKVKEEIDEIVGDEEINNEHLSKLIYIRQVIDETLRVYNPVHTVRIAEKEMIIGGHRIPKGTIIYQHLDSCQVNQKFWKHPDIFDPNNFDAENVKTRHPYAFKPFGFAGKRICPGKSFSYVFLTTFVAVWFRNFNFTMLPGQTTTFTQPLFPRLAIEMYFSVTSRR